MFKREFISVDDWKESYIFVKYVLPFLVLLGVIIVALGNRESTFMFINAVLFLVFVKAYTKRVGTVKKGKSNEKYKRVIRNVLEVVLIIIGLVLLYDDVRYGVAMTQVQVQNEGYVTGKIKVGDKKGIDLYVEEEEQDKIYWHVFDGNKYLSKVEAKGLKDDLNKKEDELGIE